MTALRWGLLPFGIQLLGDARDVDFASFWAASDLALHGQPEGAYAPEIHARVQAGLSAAENGYAAFFYPPGFLLICLPLALLGFLPALVLWLGLTGAAWAVVARRFLPARFPRGGAGWLGLLAFPPAWNNFWHGQNGFLSAALLGGGALALDRRPFLAGLCLGGLSYKPQIALLAGPALLAARRWSALAGFCAAVLLLNGFALLLFGWRTWEAFFANMALARAVLEQELVGSAKMQSVFAAIRLLGGGLTMAYAAQMAVTGGVAAVVVWVASRRPGGMAEGALLAAGAVLASPFMLDYDLVLLSLPIGWVLCQADSDGAFLAWEKTVLALAFLLALVGRTVAMRWGVPIAPVVLLAMFGVVARRVRVTAMQSTGGKDNSQL